MIGEARAHRFPTLALTSRSPALFRYRARAQASHRSDLLMFSSLAGAAAGVVGGGAGFAVQRRYFPMKGVPVVARAFFVMWAGFMPFMLVKGVTQNKMQKAARAATTDAPPAPPD